MKEFNKTTGKIYKDKNLICTQCNTIVAMLDDNETSWANTKCTACGCKSLIRYQQTTAKLPNVEET